MTDFEPFLIFRKPCVLTCATSHPWLVCSHEMPQTPVGVEGKGNRKGFSLIEILVATVILTGIILLLSSVAHQVSKAWQDVGSENQRRNAARVLLHYMARELQGASNPVPTAPGAATTANLQLLANLPATDANPGGIPTDILYPHAIFWQSPVAQNVSRGTIAEVGYFVRWDNNPPGKAQAQLCRFFVEPSDSSNYLIYTTGSSWTSAASTVASATTPKYMGWLSDNVIALWIRCLDSSGQPITKNAAGQVLNGGYGFDSLQGYQEASGIIHLAPALPPCIEIALVVIDSRTVQRIKAPIMPVVTTPEDFSKDAKTVGSILYFMDHLPPDIKAGARMFSTRVFLATSKGN